MLPPILIRLPLTPVMLPVMVVACDGISNCTGPGRLSELAYVAAAVLTCLKIAPAGLSATLL